MSFDPEEIKKRYSQVEREADKLGRVITVGRLKPSQQARVADMAGEGTVNLFRIVACVRKIDDDNIPFAKSRGELDSMLDRLDEEGIEAAGKALMKLAGVGDDGQPVDPVAAAKNLPPAQG